jgi:putative SOS response-associated peptidase YedK
MCNDFGNHIPYSPYLAAFSQTRIPVRWPQAAPNLEPREDIWPTDKAPVIRRLEDGTNQFVELRWGFPPARSKGAPIINFRSEKRRFPVGRCLIPASHFFEFTGTKSPKQKWKFTKVGEDWFCFAGLCVQCPKAVKHSRCSRPHLGRMSRPFMTGKWSSWSVLTGRLGLRRREMKLNSSERYQQGR